MEAFCLSDDVSILENPTMSVNKRKPCQVSYLLLQFPCEEVMKLRKRETSNSRACREDDESTTRSPVLVITKDCGEKKDPG